MSVSKLPLHIYSLKSQPSKSQQEGNLVGVQAHPFHEVSHQGNLGCSATNGLQRSFQHSGPAQGTRCTMGTKQQSKLGKAVGSGAGSGKGYDSDTNTWSSPQSGRLGVSMLTSPNISHVLTGHITGSTKNFVPPSCAYGPSIEANFSFFSFIFPP